MALMTVFSDAQDGQIQSASGANYLANRAGATLTATTNGANFGHGQLDFFGTACFEGFTLFDTSALGAGASVSSVVLSLFGQAAGGALAWTSNARLLAWGPTLTTADWVAGASVSALPLLATFDASGWSTTSYNAYTSQAAFPSNINLTGTTGIILTNSKFEAGTAPAGFTSETLNCYGTDQTGTTNDPKLEITYTAGAMEISSPAAAITFSVPSTRIGISATSPAALLSASATSKITIVSQSPSSSVALSMPDDDFPGFEDGFDEGTRVVWSATMLANANFSALASLPNTAVVVQSPSGLVTFSVPPISVPVRLLTPSANVNFSAANPSLAEILRAVPAHTLFSSLASAAYSPTGRGNANLNALALAAWYILSPAALTTYAGGAKVAWQPAVVAALTTFSGGNVSLNLPIVNITSPGSVSFSALAIVAEILKAVPANTNFSSAAVVAWQPVAVARAQFSAQASAQWAATTRATVTFNGGTPKLAWVLQAIPAHALFSAVADYLLGGSLIQTPAASVLFSGAPGVTVPVRVQAVSAHALFSSGMPRLEESLSAIGSASFQAVARASLTPAPSPASVLYTAPAPTVIWTARVTPAQAVFSGSASAQRSLTTPAGLVTLTGVPPALENSVTTTAADATFDTPLIVVVKPGVILDTISTGMILPLGPGQTSLPQTGTTNRPLVGTTRRRQI